MQRIYFLRISLRFFNALIQPDAYYYYYYYYPRVYFFLKILMVLLKLHRFLGTAVLKKLTPYLEPFLFLLALDNITHCRPTDQPGKEKHYPETHHLVHEWRQKYI